MSRSSATREPSWPASRSGSRAARRSCRTAAILQRTRTARRSAASEIIERALGEAGASLADVVRTRVYLVQTSDFEEVGRAHGEVFGTIRPANTTLTVAELVDPRWLVEIEAEAVVSGP